MLRKHLHRRTILKGLGASIALLAFRGRRIAGAILLVLNLAFAVWFFYGITSGLGTL